ncbi:MAG: hypothetical protein IJ634_05610 [Bacteroidales bacterium]|nr:hypothetical protein [Bacteroidales bacterium]
MNPEGKVLVTKYAGNTAAVVHYDATRATVLHRVVLSGVGTISSGNVENWVTATPSYDVGGELLELATSADHSTYLLQTTDYPASGITTTMPWLVKFDHNVASTSSVQAAACYYKNQSIDVALSAMYPRSSGYSTYLVTYLPITNISTLPCKHPASLPVHYSTIGVLMPEMSEGAWPKDWPTGGAYRYAAAVNVQVICN